MQILKMAALRRESLKSFCCSVCDKTYRYEPPFLKHMAKHRLEDSLPTSASLTSAASWWGTNKIHQQNLKRWWLSFQVALAQETEKRIKLELLVKSRGLRSSGLDWRQMFTLSHLEEGMVTYFTSCKPHIAYDTTATKGLDILWTFFQMLSFFIFLFSVLN